MHRPPKNVQNYSAGGNRPPQRRKTTKRLSKGYDEDVKGYDEDVKGYAGDVKGNNVDVKGYDVDVKGFANRSRPRRGFPLSARENSGGVSNSPAVKGLIKGLTAAWSPRGEFSG
eukprot:5838845-Pyramimonas_sp.AAC.1